MPGPTRHAADFLPEFGDVADNLSYYLGKSRIAKGCCGWSLLGTCYKFKELRLADYRWNASEAAIGYDQAASHVHPRYLEIQDAILRELEAAVPSGGLIVDLGGGSGRLAERIAERFAECKVVVVDQSESFLAIAAGRLERFGKRATCVLARLQDRWEKQLLQAPRALVSMSAIHHLMPEEKQQLYRRCFDALTPGGVLLNGDEVRPVSEDEYRQQVDKWWRHMQGVIADGLVSPKMSEVLVAWKVRNVDQFGSSRKSGDDCLETAETQIGYLCTAGFAEVDVPWQAELWGILRAKKN